MLHLKSAKLAGWQLRLVCWSGALLWLSGARPKDTLHILYGIAPFLALGYAFSWSASAKPRREALTLGVAALFTFGLIIRAYTTGR